MESSTNSASMTSGGFAFLKHRQWRFCLWVFIGSVGLNVLAAFLLRSHENISTIDLDEREYWNDATAFLHSGIGSFMAKRTPPFPILVAILRSTFGNNYLTVQVALSILLGLSAVLVFCVVQRQLKAELTAKIACIGFLLWPLFVRYNVTLYADFNGAANLPYLFAGLSFAAHLGRNGPLALGSVLHCRSSFKCVHANETFVSYLCSIRCCTGSFS